MELKNMKNQILEKYLETVKIIPDYMIKCCMIGLDFDQVEIFE